MTARKMKDSGIEWIGEIPEEWKVCQLKRFVTVNNGREIEEEIDKSQDAIPVYGSGGVFKYTTKPMYDGTAVLFGRKGTLGKPLFVQGKLWAVDTMYFLTHSCEISPKYNYYQLSSFDWEPYITHTALPSVVASEIVSCLFPFPPLPEQHRIADYLDRKCAEIDRVAAETEKTIEEYKVLKQSVITEAVTHGVRGKRPMKDSGIEWIGEIPEEWKKDKIRHYAEFYNGDRTSRYPKPEDLKNEGIPFLSSREIDKDIVDISKTKFISKEKYDSLAGAKLQIGDIVFCLRGSIGKCAMNQTLQEGTVASSLMTIRPRGVIGKYLLYYLFSDVVQIQTSFFMNGTCAANLSAENVGAYILLVPPLPEQREIADYLDAKCAEIDRLVAAKQMLLAELATYKKSLIYEYVTGKKEAPECL